MYSPAFDVNCFLDFNLSDWGNMKPQSSFNVHSLTAMDILKNDLSISGNHLRHCSIAVKKHHEHRNSYKRKYFNWGQAYGFNARFIIIMVR